MGADHDPVSLELDQTFSTRVLLKSSMQKVELSLGRTTLISVIQCGGTSTFGMIPTLSDIEAHVRFLPDGEA